jgi:peptidoglycan hydrolase-like amidase
MQGQEIRFEASPLPLPRRGDSESDEKESITYTATISKDVQTGKDYIVLTGNDTTYNVGDSVMFESPSPCERVGEASTFSLHGVTIGKEFHWQQQETQTFQGSLILRIIDGELHAINRIPIEDYLTSVIASEMSGTSSVELLKAHAIISRSWLLAQIGASPLPLPRRGDAGIADNKKFDFSEYSERSEFSEIKKEEE